MTTDTSKFQVGAFVISAVAIGLATLIWLGATKFFEDTTTFVTYFDESVQGLDPGSAVKFRGVPAGRVSAVQIAPDSNLIEVVLDVDIEAAEVIKKEANCRAKLELTGITGLRYIEIEQREGKELQDAPLLNFEPSYPIIPSAKSRFAAVQTALADVYDRVMELDIEGLSADGRGALRSANSAFDQLKRVIEDPRVNRTLDSIEKASASAAQIGKDVERITAGLDLQSTINNADEAAVEARELIASLNRVTTQEIAGAAQDFALVAQTAQQVMAGIQYSIDRLDRTISGLRGFTDEVRSQPSRLLFSSPPPPREDAGPGGATQPKEQP